MTFTVLVAASAVLTASCADSEPTDTDTGLRGAQYALVGADSGDGLDGSSGDTATNDGTSDSISSAATQGLPVVMGVVDPDGRAAAEAASCTLEGSVTTVEDPRPVWRPWRDPASANDRVARAEAQDMRTRRGPKWTDPTAPAATTATRAALPSAAVLAAIGPDTPPLSEESTRGQGWRDRSPAEDSAHAAGNSVASAKRQAIVDAQTQYLAWLAANPTATSAERAAAKKTIFSTIGGAP